MHPRTKPPIDDDWEARMTDPETTPDLQPDYWHQDTTVLKDARTPESNLSTTHGTAQTITAVIDQTRQRTRLLIPGRLRYELIRAGWTPPPDPEWPPGYQWYTPCLCSHPANVHESGEGPALAGCRRCECQEFARHVPPTTPPG